LINQIPYHNTCGWSELPGGQSRPTN